MYNFPCLQTERLMLNRLELSDVPNITLHCSNPKVNRYLLTVPNPYFEQDAIWWIKNSRKKFEEGIQYNFAIRLEEGSNLIGTIGLIVDKNNRKANLGYWLGEEYWNKGFMTEAIKATIKFAFKDLNLNKVYASHFERNAASGKAMQKAGMQKEGFLKAEFCKDNEVINAYRYAVVNNER